MKVSSVLILLVLIGIVAVVGLAYTGVINVGFLNKKDLTEAVDKGLETVQGYTAAKTPAEAVQHFHTAIQKRQYKVAARYCVKGAYADGLDRANSAAGNIGGVIDEIRSHAKDKGLLTDKVQYFLQQLDPFPKTLKIDKPAEQKGDAKALAFFGFEQYPYTDLPKFLQNDSDFNPKHFDKQYDRKMFENVLAKPIQESIFTAATPAPKGGGPIELVKEGEEWKLNVAATAGWLVDVNYYVDHEKVYYEALDSFRSYMGAEQARTPAGFETELINKLRPLKK